MSMLTQHAGMLRVIFRYWLPYLFPYALPLLISFAMLQYHRAKLNRYTQQGIEENKWRHQAVIVAILSSLSLAFFLMFAYLLIFRLSADFR